MKLKHWCAFLDVFGLKASPVLGFEVFSLKASRRG
jgi:hypothetical protein